jgi:hypothetical protein
MPTSANVSEQPKKINRVYETRSRNNFKKTLVQTQIIHQNLTSTNVSSAQKNHSFINRF